MCACQARCEEADIQARGRKMTPMPDAWAAACLLNLFTFVCSRGFQIASEEILGQVWERLCFTDEVTHGFDHQTSISFFFLLFFFSFCCVDCRGLEIQISKSFSVDLGNQGCLFQLALLPWSSPGVLADVLKNKVSDFSLFGCRQTERSSVGMWFWSKGLGLGLG